ncbi:hypothetical protein SAMN06265220_1011013 [Flavobacterium nitrogenifigens]|uniref:Uncharacterized protein n=1 Tax=Flavobacterium nitrogenifigens TaxID=1617283 RepID=A0A521BHG0_9FLAO|nr:hypothetical protein SAMN06265220_1011013 [Flavobacterium nitrogenifigens]
MEGGHVPNYNMKQEKLQLNILIINDFKWNVLGF